MGAAPRVSVIIAAFNAASTVREACDSVLSQTYPDVELIVVDDGSTDATPKILAEYGDRVRVVSQRNGGLASARNAGVRAARGELIALMDADDRCHPERVAVQAGALALLPEARLCGSEFSAFDAAGTVSPSHGSRYYSVIGETPGGLASLFRHCATLTPELGGGAGAPAHVLHGSVYPDIAFGNFVHPPTVMFRRAAFDAAGPFDESLRYSSDWEWFVRVARLGPFQHLTRPLLEYRLSPSQMSGKSVNEGKSAVDIVRAAEKIWRADPALAKQHRARIRRCRREFHFDAAYAIADKHPALAARMLATSVWHGARVLPALKTAIRIAMPARLQRVARASRGRAASNPDRPTRP